ncbi:MAG: hypothetical protein ABGY96_05300 [bacterium]
MNAKVINLPMERLKREQRKIRNVELMTFSDYIEHLLKEKHAVSATPQGHL